MAQWHAAGMSNRHIAAQLNEEGVPTLSGKGEWQPGTVGKMVQHPRTAAHPAGEEVAC